MYQVNPVKSVPFELQICLESGPPHFHHPARVVDLHLMESNPGTLVTQAAKAFFLELLGMFAGKAFLAELPVVFPGEALFTELPLVFLATLIFKLPLVFSGEALFL